MVDCRAVSEQGSRKDTTMLAKVTEEKKRKKVKVVVPMW